MRGLLVIVIVALGCGLPAATPERTAPAKPVKPADPVPVAKVEAPVAAPPVERCAPSTTGPLRDGGTVRFPKPQPMKPGTTGMPAPVHPIPKLVHGQGTVSGGYDLKTVHRYLRRRDQDFSYCFELELVHNSDLAGRVMLMFTIEGDGKVRQGCARGITSSIETCIDGVTKAMQFPPPVDNQPVEVTYPLDFAGEWPAGSVPLD